MIGVKCKICGKENLVKYGYRGKDDKPCYRCKDCGHQPTNLNHRADHYDKYVTRWLYGKYGNNYIQVNKNRLLAIFNNKPDIPKEVKPRLTINQIAKLLGQHINTTTNWATNPKFTNTKINRTEFIEYVGGRENGDVLLDLLCENGQAIAEATLARITKRKPRTRTSHKQVVDEFGNVGWRIVASKENRQDEREYLEIERATVKEYRQTCVNEFCRQVEQIPIENRKDAIAVLGVLLRCELGEIIGARYTDFCPNTKTIVFTRYIDFIEGVIKENAYRNVYPLTEKINEMVEWLRDNENHNKQILGTAYDNAYKNFLCVNETGKLLHPREVDKHIHYLCKKFNIAIVLYFSDLHHFR